MENLDPGITLQRASVLKSLALVRMEAARRNFQHLGDTFQIDYDKEVSRAKDEIIMALGSMQERNSLEKPRGLTDS